MPQGNDRTMSRVPEDAPLLETDGAGITSQREARDFARKHFQTLDGQPIRVTNVHDGADIELTMSGIKHTSNNARNALLKTIAVTDEILRRGVYLGAKPDTKRSRVRKVHYYGIRVAVDGEPHNVVVVVKEFVDGKRYYDHSIERKPP